MVPREAFDLRSLLNDSIIYSEMLKIQRFVCNMFAVNSYVVSDETKECLFVDCGAFYPEERAAIRRYVQEEQLKPVALICTHGHLDHVLGNSFLYEEYGLKAQVHAEDEYLISNIPEQARSMVGMNYQERIAPIGAYLHSTDKIRFGSHQLEIIHTPGHTPGCVVYYCKEEKVAFTGDTIFNMSIGRTDFPGGSWGQMMQSLKLLVNLLPKDTTLLTGHGDQTTMDYECQWNPYLKS